MSCDHFYYHDFNEELLSWKFESIASLSLNLSQLIHRAYKRFFSFPVNALFYLRGASIALLHIHLCQPTTKSIHILCRILPSCLAKS